MIDPSRPQAIEVSGLFKSFRMPEPAPRSLRSRLLHPVERSRARELRALDGISFQVAKGEFFGIVGRNGSGKSTLLRILSSIYAASGGSVRVSGRVAPLIELGVGFDPELSGRGNIVLNGVMLGLSPRELRRRSDAVLEFAELEEFADVAVKNYSAGMRVRLAFSVLVQTEPDVLLVDEVLAFGDAAFQERCEKVFLDLHTRGRTILLVTHNISAIQRYCDRAMVLERGKIDAIGEPRDVLRRYFEITLSHRPVEIAGPGPRVARAEADGPPRARISELRIRDRRGRPAATVEAGSPILLHATVEVDQPMRPVGLRLEVRTEHGARVFAPPDPAVGEKAQAAAPGARLRAEGTIENRLSPGRYMLSCTALHATGRRCIAASPVRTVPFEIEGTSHPGAGLVALDHTVRLDPDLSRELSVRR